MTAVVPLEQVLVEYVAAWLAQIRTADGYHTDAGLLVYPEEPAREQNPDLGLVVRDVSGSQEADVWLVELEISAALPVGSAPRETGRQLLHDIRRALRKRSARSARWHPFSQPNHLGAARARGGQ